MNLGTVPLVVVALLLVTAQPGVDTVTTVVDGTQELSDATDATIVTDGTVTLPADASTTTTVYVVGGTLRVDGSLDGRVVQFSGDVDVGPDGAITDAFEVYGGSQDVAPSADATPSVVAEPLTQRRSPVESVGLFGLQAGVLAAVAFLLGQRYPDLLANVGHSIHHHPVVSGTVGLLAATTLLALFVFMAFTLVLLPVSLLGLAAGAFVLLYATVGVGFLVGQHLPIARPGPATAAGSVGFYGATRLLGFVPVVGDAVALVAFVVAVGAVVVTYFGLRRFEPPKLQPVG